MRRVPKKHSVCSSQGQGVACTFLPCLMLRARHQLLALNSRKLAKRSIRCLIAPNPLRRRIHGVPAITILVITIILVAMNHNFITNFPTCHFRTNGPYDARCVRTCYVIGLMVAIKWTDWYTKRSPHPIIIHTSSHD